jgi:hypothetical protein
MTYPGLVRANNLSDVANKEEVWDNIGDNYSTGPIEVPNANFDFNFVESENLIDQVSGQQLAQFSRNSTGTYVNNQGFIATAAANVPRFEYDPVTFARTGLLLESSVTNLLPNHIIPAHAGAKFNSSVDTTIQTPKGDLSGVRLLTRNSSPTAGPEALTASIFLTATTRYTVSVFYKILSGSPLSGGCFFAFQASGPFEEAIAAISSSTTISYPNGWKRAFATLSVSSSRNFDCGIIYNNAQSLPAGTSIAYWGMQVEQSFVVSSYIPTSGSTATRQADIFTISGNSFNSFYNAAQGTFYAEYYKLATLFPLVSLGTSNRWIQLDDSPLGFPRTTWSGAFYFWTTPNAQPQTSRQRFALSYGTGLRQAVDNAVSTVSPPLPNNFLLTASGIAFQGALSRVVYWRQELPQILLGGITSLSGSSLGEIPSAASLTSSIKGKDITALTDVKNTSVKDFVFIKGLTSSAQSRLTTVNSNTLATAALRDNSLLKNIATSSGNYFFSSGRTLSGISTRINGTNARSIATSPFSGSNATTSLFLSNLQVQSNWRITEPMTAGTIASPQLAIPFETDNFVLFMKAGQS